MNFIPTLSFAGGTKRSKNSSLPCALISLAITNISSKTIIYTDRDTNKKSYRCVPPSHPEERAIQSPMSKQCYFNKQVTIRSMRVLLSMSPIRPMSNYSGVLMSKNVKVNQPDSHGDSS